MDVTILGGTKLGEPLKARVPEHVSNLLRQAGALADQLSVCAFVVGGFVRDLLLGIENFDLDLVIEGDGIAFARALGRNLGVHVQVYDRFGTAVLMLPHRVKLDVATARGESYAHPTALPVVKPGSLEKDLFRRDFTINTLAIPLNRTGFGELLDVRGGLRDLQRKTIRVLHDRSFVDDPTRLFRAIRFAQRFGFRMEANTLRLLKEAAATDLVHRLSGPRLRNEIMLLLAEKDVSRTIQRMGTMDLLRFIHPRVRPTLQVEILLKHIAPTMAWWTKRFPDRRLDRPLVYFMGLIDGLTLSAAEAALKRLAFPNRQADKVRHVKQSLPSALRTLSARRSLKPSAVYRPLSALPDEGLVLLAAKSTSLSDNVHATVKREISAYLTTYRHITPSLTGDDLTDLGLKPGPLYKKILGRLRDARLNEEVSTKAEERALVKRIAKL